MTDVLTRELLTGIVSIDEQHRNLFVRAGTIIEAMQGSHARTDVLRLLDFLHRYCEEHFASEESAMERFHVPDLLKHHTAHRLYRSKVQILRDELDLRGPSAELARLAQLTLVDLFKTHIQEHDIPMARHLRERADGDFGL
jgi:hemerythrin